MPKDTFFEDIAKAAIGKPKIEIHASWFHHSDKPEKGLNLGSMISHIPGKFRPGLFDNSKVLMFEFVRGESIKGVILNKQMENGLRLGGPVGLSSNINKSEKIILHNIKAI
jgi:hypothetical protein